MTEAEDRSIRPPGIVTRIYRHLARSGFPFMPFPSGGVQPLRRLRHLARRSVFGERPSWQRWPLRAAMTLAWPIGAIFAIRRQLLGGPATDRPAGMQAWFGRFSHMLRLALIHNVPPRDYVAYRLHDPARSDRIGASIFGAEILWLMSLLNRLNAAAIDDVQDKARFARLCARHGLPCIPTLAAFKGGVQIEPGAPFSPDLPVLWIKDLAGSHGAGASCWRRDGDVYRDIRSGHTCAPAALVAKWRRRDCIVQPRLENHPVLADLSDGTLADFRLVTGIDREGRVTIVAAMAQIPCGGFAERYIFAAVNEAGEIRDPGIGGIERVTHHPDTGALISEIKVPFWADALALVSRAHCDVPEFSRFAFLGWDVAITAAGPLLIEANAGWGGFNHQLGDGIPLGSTALPAIALAHLEGLRRCG